MNNYEHIVQGGIDALVGWHLAFDSAHICERNRSGEIGSCECCDIATDPYCPTEHLRAWLEAEYVEPDSWDKLLEDMGKDDDSTLPCCYFGQKPDSCTDDCPPFGSGFSCWYMVFKDVEGRIRELRGEEE